jgi:hypothetical protein
MIINIDDIIIEGTTYKRKLDIEGTLFRLNQSKIEIPADIIYLSTNDIELGRNIFNSKKVNTLTSRKTFEAGMTTVFVVDNNTKVNPATGEYDINSSMGEYDYFMYLLNNMNLLVANSITSLENELLPASINRSIAAGRLDYE